MSRYFQHSRTRSCVCWREGSDRWKASLSWVAWASEYSEFCWRGISRVTQSASASTAAVLAFSPEHGKIGGGRIVYGLRSLFVFPELARAVFYKHYGIILFCVLWKKISDGHMEDGVKTRIRKSCVMLWGLLVTWWKDVGEKLVENWRKKVCGRQRDLSSSTNHCWRLVVLLSR